MHMLAALYARRSEETCLESIDAAIEYARSEELKKCFRRYTLGTGLIGLGTRSLYFAKATGLRAWQSSVAGTDIKGIQQAHCCYQLQYHQK
jgi:hypothetical protein